MTERAGFGIGQVPSKLLHPFFGRVARNSGRYDSASLQLNHEQDVIGDQPSSDHSERSIVSWVERFRRRINVCLNLARPNRVDGVGAGAMLRCEPLA